MAHGRPPKSENSRGWYIAAGVVVLAGSIAVILKPSGPPVHADQKGPAFYSREYVHTGARAPINPDCNCDAPSNKPPAPVYPFGIPPTFAPVYQIVSEQNTPLDDVPRKTVRVIVPVGLDRAALNINLKHAAKHEKDLFGVAAVRVLAYLDKASTLGKETVGRCDLAPYGIWDRANAKVPETQYAAHVTVVESYFKAPAVHIPARIASIPMERRKQIYAEVKQADVKAIKDTEVAYPPSASDDQRLVEAGQMRQNLTSEYRADVRNRYHLMDDQVNAIVTEGDTLHWPTISADSVRTVHN